MGMSGLLKFCLAAAFIAVLGLLVSGNRVLVWQAKVEPGQRYEVEGWGDLGKNQQASLACYYFTGRSIKPQVYWYSPSNVMGKDECPTTIKPAN
jgi:hypothetical protein